MRNVIQRTGTRGIDIGKSSSVRHGGGMGLLRHIQYLGLGDSVCKHRDIYHPVSRG